MKPVFFFLLLVATCTTLHAQDKFDLILDENFNGTELNRNTWNTHYIWGRTITASHELEYYTDTGNIHLIDGILNLTAKRQIITAKIDSNLADDFIFEGNVKNLSQWTFTSGMLCSKQAFLYGKFEIRCKMPTGEGLWPAFWMRKDGPPNEIDIFEFKGESHKQISTAIAPYDSVKYRRSSKWTRFIGKNFTKKFHTITCYWYPEVVIWQVDGKEIFRFTTNYPDQYKTPMPLIVNLAVSSGAFTGPPKPTEKFPKVFEVDYIKVWQLKR